MRCGEADEHERRAGAERPGVRARHRRRRRARRGGPGRAAGGAARGAAVGGARARRALRLLPRLDDLETALECLVLLLVSVLLRRGRRRRHRRGLGVHEPRLLAPPLRGPLLRVEERDRSSRWTKAQCRCCGYKYTYSHVARAWLDCRPKRRIIPPQ